MGSQAWQTAGSKGGLALCSFSFISTRRKSAFLVYLYLLEGSFLDAGISYSSLSSGGRGDSKQTRKATSNANFPLSFFFLLPQPLPGTRCPEHLPARSTAPALPAAGASRARWAPRGASSGPTGKASAGTGGVFGEAPLARDFHGKRAVTPP